MWNFLGACLLLAVMIAIGGFVLNLLWMLGFGIIAGICSLFGWLKDLCTPKKCYRIEDE